MKTLWIVAGLSLSFGMMACTAEANGDDDAESAESPVMVQQSSPTEGGACKITSGPNAGKSGTYDTTSDPGHTWCCTAPNGGGSCTECSGSTKCSDAKVSRPPVRDLGGYTIGGTITRAP